MYFNLLRDGYSGINNFRCRYCTKQGSISGRTNSFSLISPCNCDDDRMFIHPSCLEEYICSSICPNSYDHCMVCSGCYNVPLNQNFDLNQTKKNFWVSLILEYVK